MKRFALANDFAFGGITYFQDYVFLRTNLFQNVTFDDVLCINVYSCRSYRDTGLGTRILKPPITRSGYLGFRVPSFPRRRNGAFHIFTISNNNEDFHVGRRTYTATYVSEHELWLAKPIDRVPKNIDCDNGFPEGGEWTRLKRIWLIAGYWPEILSFVIHSDRPLAGHE